MIKLAEMQQFLDPCQNTDHYHFPSTTNDAHGTHACCLSYYDPICVQAAISCWEMNFYNSGGGEGRWHQKQSSIIILFTGKRVAEWPNLLAVPDLYEIYKA